MLRVPKASLPHKYGEETLVSLSPQGIKIPKTLRLWRLS